MTPTAEYDVSSFEDAQQYEADKRLFVSFATVPIKCEFKSIEAGRSIYEDRDHITIIAPGSKDSVVAEMNSHYMARFGERYKRWKAGQEQIQDGTPLDSLPWMTPGQVMEFKSANVYTVEQLIGMPDQLSQKWMGHHQLKQRAKDYLDAATSRAPAEKLAAELAIRDEKLAAQDVFIKSMQAQIDKLTAKASK